MSCRQRVNVITAGYTSIAVPHESDRADHLYRSFSHDIRICWRERVSILTNRYALIAVNTLRVQFNSLQQPALAPPPPPPLETAQTLALFGLVLVVDLSPYTSYKFDRRPAASGHMPFACGVCAWACEAAAALFLVAAALLCAAAGSVQLAAVAACLSAAAFVVCGADLCLGRRRRRRWRQRGGWAGAAVGLRLTDTGGCCPLLRAAVQTEVERRGGVFVSDDAPAAAAAAADVLVVVVRLRGTASSAVDSVDALRSAVRGFVRARASGSKGTPAAIVVGIDGWEALSGCGGRERCVAAWAAYGLVEGVRAELGASHPCVCVTTVVGAPPRGAGAAAHARLLLGAAHTHPRVYRTLGDAASRGLDLLPVGVRRWLCGFASRRV